ncbi:hypothetical protein ACR9YC_11955 [Parasphingorhabdus sp. DH2-15]|uniref:hypothetical protein n=1 Tax=Parasphingorhabdus sp. DH2-15 TaxID=3444112 RepID=UPI003F683E62
MTVLDDVAHMIGSISPEAICDDCITDRLGLTVRQHANHKTRILAEEAGYMRQKDICSVCDSTKLVIKTV